MLNFSQYRRQLGVTLIETMMVIVIMAILLSIGVPSMSSWFVSAQVSAKSEAVLNGLQFARAEALRRNVRVIFRMNADSSWVVGCVVASANCPAQITAKPSTEGGENVTITLSPSDATEVTFNSFGAVTANASGDPSLLQVDFSKSGGGVSSTKRILVTAGGQSRICDPAVSTNGDPNKC